MEIDYYDYLEGLNDLLMQRMEDLDYWASKKKGKHE